MTSTAATQSDCVVVGASFAGLACATALARAGMRVIVLERKSDVGEKLHTTGILVKDAIDQIALLDDLPPAIVRRSKFLFGVEHEYCSVELGDPDRLHCFIDRRLAPGYIGWIVAGVGVVQVGLAGRVQSGRLTATEAIAPFLEKIAAVADFRGATPASIRAGMIPCGGVVSPVATRRAMLVGDAAGMVSPVTAGGIHTAFKHGLAAGHAIADFLNGKTGDPSEGFVRRIHGSGPSGCYGSCSITSRATPRSTCCSAPRRCARPRASSIFTTRASSIDVVSGGVRSVRL